MTNMSHVSTLLKSYSPAWLCPANTAAILRSEHFGFVRAHGDTSPETSEMSTSSDSSKSCQRKVPKSVSYFVLVLSIADDLCPYNWSEMRWLRIIIIMAGAGGWCCAGLTRAAGVIAPSLRWLETGRHWDTGARDECRVLITSGRRGELWLWSPPLYCVLCAVL